MPRIRKRTSNRQSLNDRYKIRHKIKEGRKKKKKEAKNNTQWKSKHKKDPGIPNDFPFKDQILAEVAEQRRIAAEEKEKRKRDKKANGGSLPASDGQTTSMEVDDAHDENAPAPPLSEMKNSDVDGDAIASISAKVIDPKRATIRKKVGDVETVADEEEEEAPILMNHEVLGAVLDKSDVLLQVLDARDPLAFRSSYLEKAMEGKKVLLVLNKIDTCPRESTSAWLTFLRREHPTFLFRSATAFLPAAALESSNPIQETGKSKASSSHRKDGALGSEAILTQLANWAGEKTDGSPLNVAVVGLTNAGKSSFLNSLLHKEALPVYSLSTASRNPTTTVLPQEVTIESQGKPIRFNDTPGLIWSTGSEGGSVSESESDNLRVRDILVRSRGRIDRLKDPLPVVSHIVSRANTEDLMVMYGLPAFKSGDGTAFLSGVARSNHLVKKRGELDLSAASRIVLRDWNVGKFARFTVPPGDKSVPLELSEADKEVLECVRTRKEMRRSGGLVKLVASEMENREVDLERPWTWIGKEEESSDDEEEDEYDEGEIEDDEMELDEEKDDNEEDGDNSDEDEEADKHPEPEPEPETEFKPPAKGAIQKRKRAASVVSGQPPLTKKVAFASVGPDKASRISLKHRGQKQQSQQQKQKEGLGRPRQEVKSILKKAKKRGAKLN